MEILSAVRGYGVPGRAELQRTCPRYELYCELHCDVWRVEVVGVVRKGGVGLGLTVKCDLRAINRETGTARANSVGLCPSSAPSPIPSHNTHTRTHIPRTTRMADYPQSNGAVLASLSPTLTTDGLVLGLQATGPPRLQGHPSSATPSTVLPALP